VSARYPYIFIFSGHSGKQHGYQDGWDNPNVFAYTGEGQTGDMSFTRGNLALREHLNTGKRVFLFEQLKQKGYVKFICEIEYFDADYFQTKDREGKLRTGIKFFFKRAEAVVPKLDLFAHSIASEPMLDINSTRPNVTERKGLVTSRVGQGMYRKRIIHRWEYQCAVTGFDKLDVLIASHILPWAEASDEQRLDVHNGLLLSPAYDALFDRHLISFENNGKIILSDKIQAEAFERIKVLGNEKIKNLSEENHFYLDMHREVLNSGIWKS